MRDECHFARFVAQVSQNKERAMKLTSNQVDRILDQFEAQAIPDNHPVIPQLQSLFGDHTYFIDKSGLNIVEPTDSGQQGTELGLVVNVANWTDSNPRSLEPHDPEPTDIVITLGRTH
jgi:hypothetical protein